MKSLLVFILLISFGPSLCIAQASSYSDPAQAYLRILIEKEGEGSYQKIGNFRVRGSSLLYGGNQNGDAYFKNGSAKNVNLSYDTYKQTLSVGTPDAKGNTMLMQLNSLDSFVLKADDDTEFKTDLHFVNTGLFDSSKKVFLQIVATGSRFTLYKAYKSDLGIVSTNYIQSELRQFDLNYEYYYSDKQEPGLKRLKTSPNAVKKEFKNIKDVSEYVDVNGFNANPEKSLVRLFKALNG